MDVIDAWKEVCIQALEMRMEACLSMLLKNRDRVIESDEECVVFRKPNGHLHFFNHSSFQAMEALVEALKEEGPIVLPPSRPIIEGFVLDSRKVEKRSSRIWIWRINKLFDLPTKLRLNKKLNNFPRH